MSSSSPVDSGLYDDMTMTVDTLVPPTRESRTRMTHCTYSCVVNSLHNYTGSKCGVVFLFIFYTDTFYFTMTRPMTMTVGTLISVIPVIPPSTCGCTKFALDTHTSLIVTQLYGQ